jgi:hypothetical protein
MAAALRRNLRHLPPSRLSEDAREVGVVEAAESGPTSNHGAPGAEQPARATPPKGDGSVVFSVMPKKHLAMGAKVANEAMVVFDSNAPIKTPTWTNHMAGPVPQALSMTPASLVFRHVPIFGISDGTSPAPAVTLTKKSRSTRRARRKS